MRTVSVVAPAVRAESAEPMQAAKPRPGEYIPTLDGWRAVAILLVVLDHASDSIDGALRSVGMHLPHTLSHRGQMGVYIFFALSGYLITSRLLSEHTQTGRISLRNFYIRRAFRIFPLMALFLTVAGGLAMAGIIPAGGSDFRSAALFYANYNAGRSWYIGHYWSLCVEEHFYMLWPAMLIGLLAFGHRRAALAALGVAVAIAAWREVVLATHITGYVDNLYSRTDLVMDTLLLGAVAATLMMLARFRAWVSQLPWGVWVVLALLTAGTTIIKVPEIRLVQSALLMGLMLGTVTHAGSWCGRLLDVAVLRWVGRLSYSLYVWQQIFLVWGDLRSPAMGALQDFPLNVAAAFACAVPSYYLLERPLTRLGHELTKTRVPTSVAAPAGEPISAKPVASGSPAVLPAT